MATYTDNYQLEKPLYSETADVAVLNRNADKIDDILHASQVSLAPAYVQNETYNTGDVVMYEFLMYECLEDNVTGVWDATKWQRTTAGEHGGGSSASEVSYDNTNSGLEADNVQDALDEIVENIPREEITGEASGAIASFADGSANPLKSLVVDINPVQAGSGTPSPSNIRPISGWSSVEVTKCGKNLYNDVFADYTKPSDYRICPIPLEIGKTYTASAKLVGTAVSGCTIGIAKKGDRYSNFGSFITLVNSSGDVYTNTITLDSSWTSPKLIVYAANETTFNSLFENYEIQLEVGSTATSYEPYNADTETISLGQTVYGGKLNVTTGELTVDWVNVIYDGTENITLSSYHFYTLPIPKEHSIDASVDRCICSLAKFANLTLAEYPRIATGNVASVYWLWVDPSSELYDNLSALKAWIAQMYANGTPLQLCYKTTEPTTIQLTPTQVSSLLGSNNILADSGDVDVVYIRDIDKAFNILWNAVMNSNSGTRSLNLMKGAISETKEDIEEPIKEEEETKEGNDENQR